MEVLSTAPGVQVPVLPVLPLPWTFLVPKMVRWSPIFSNGFVGFRWFHHDDGYNVNPG
jgi:hypothetical protein